MKFAKNWESNERNSRKPWWMGFIAACGLLFLSFGAGCTIPVSWDEVLSPTATTTAPMTTSTWQEVGPGLARLDQRFTANGAAARVVVWRIKPEAKLTWSLMASSTFPYSVSQWADQLPQATFILNGGYFHDDGLPSGWAQMHGERLGERAFDAKRSGLITLGAQPHLLPGSTATSSVRVDALQSYPWLIERGKIAFTQETGQYARRTFLGVDTKGDWYIGVVPIESVTLYQLAKLLPEMPIQWQSVLNLDGGPSTGLVSHTIGAEDRFDSFGPVPYIIVAQPTSSTIPAAN